MRHLQRKPAAPAGAGRSARSAASAHRPGRLAGAAHWARGALPALQPRVASSRPADASDRIARQVMRAPAQEDKGAASAAPATLGGKVTMLFDGDELTVFDDGKEAFRFPATSGRPTPVKAAHATLCKGATSETYVNNPRYVALIDHGPIPEGSYSFHTSGIQLFSEAEQLELIDAAARGTGEISVGTPKSAVHTGDWGRGRVHLRPSKVEPGPKPCTDTKKRSGFYLHGGILRGSAGCIDIGSQFDNLAAALGGNKQKIELTVKYKEKITTALTPCELMFGEVMYDKVTPNPLTFIPCFTELTDNADPEAKLIYEGLRARFLGRMLGGGTTPPGGGTTPGGTTPGGTTPGGSLLDLLNRLLGGTSDTHG